MTHDSMLASFLNAAVDIAAQSYAHGPQCPRLTYDNGRMVRAGTDRNSNGDNT